MIKFIELHDLCSGSRISINLSQIVDVFEFEEEHCSVYINAVMGSKKFFEIPHIKVSESYDEVMYKIRCASCPST